MSRGYWDYANQNLGYEMFPGCSISCGLSELAEEQKKARKINPLEDRLVSELVFDVLCLLYSADTYLSGDFGKEDYVKDLKFFKSKWIKNNNVCQEHLDKVIDDLREELEKEFER